jgi:hypothetical protein
VRQAEPPQREHGRRQVDDRLPPDGERRVHPRERAAESELEVEGGVHDQRQQHQERDEGEQVRGGQRRPSRRATQCAIREPDERGARGEVRRVHQGGAHRQAPQENVAEDHREGRDQGGEGPPAIEDREDHRAEHVGGEAVARQRDAVAAGEGADDDEREGRQPEARTRGIPPGAVREERPAGGERGADGDGHLDEPRGRPEQPRGRAHATGSGTTGAWWMSRKLGRVARCVKRDYR